MQAQVSERWSEEKANAWYAGLPWLRGCGYIPASAINWGFVAGKTNTIFAWDQPIPDGKEPDVWFHDIFRQDGTPFSQEEIDTIKSLTGK